MTNFLRNIRLKFDDNNFLINTLIILAIFGNPFCLLIKVFTLKIISFDYVSPFLIYKIFLTSLIFYLFYRLKTKFNPNYIGLIFIFLIFYINIMTNNTFEVSNYLKSEYLYKQDSIGKFFEDRNKSILINFFNIFLIIILFTFKNIFIDFEHLKKIMQISCKIFLYFTLLIGVIWIIQEYVNKTNSINYLIKDTFSNDNFWINSHYISYIIIINFALFIEEFSKKNLLATLAYTIFVISFKLHIAAYIMIFLLVFNFVIRNYKLNIFILLIIFILTIFIPIFYYFFENFLNFLNFSNFSYFKNFSLSITNRINIYEFYLANFKNINIFFGNSLFSPDIPTYPHNLVFDLLYSTGLVGLSIFLIVLFNILKRMINSQNLFFINLFISFLMFSSLSGYFFFNIFLITAVLISFQFLKEK